MQAIRTKFYGPTNTKGARVQVSAEAATIYVEWDYALGVDGNHKAACEALVRKLGWDKGAYSPLVGGQHGVSYYWVFTNDDSGSGSRSPTTFDGR